MNSLVKALPALIPVLLLALPQEARSGDVIHYVACRADNEDAQSLIAIDDTTKKVCDREFASGWITPMIFNDTTVEWGDGAASRKSITRGRKGSRYEHDTYFIVVHIGHCTKLKAPAAPLCAG